MLTLTACGGGGGDDGGEGDTPATLSSIAITPASASIAKGKNTFLTATGKYSDGSTADITNQVSWTSADTSIATVDSHTGAVTGIAEGSSAVTASMNGITSPAANLTVTAAVITSISVTPTAPVTPKGTSVTFTATGTYSDGSTGNISGSVNWLSSDATVAAINSSGIASTLAQGVTTVTASANGITSNSATLTVTAPVLTAIAITPATAAVAKGLTSAFTATGAYTDGSTANITSQVSWASSNTAVATMATTGVATGVTVGSATVTASLSGITSPAASLTVNAAVVTAISITPTAPTVAKGQSVAFTATGTYSDGSTGNISGSVTWASSNTTVATLNTSGVASTLSQGSSTISASTNGVTSNTVTLTVSAPALTAIVISPSTASVAKGLTTAFTAAGTYTDGTTADITNLASWNSGDTAVATLSATGVASGVAVGATTLTASLDGISSPTAGLTVNAAVITAINITPTEPSVAKGQSVSFTATATYSDGSTGNISGSVTWGSSNTTVATVNTSGTASTLAQGSSTISASTDGVTSNSATLTVTAKELTAIAITPTAIMVATGQSAPLTATGTYTDGTTADLTSLANWSSDNTAVATVGNTGLAQGIAVGSASIAASLNGVTSNTASIMVAPAAPALSLTPQSIKQFHFSWTDVDYETEYRLLENTDGVSGYTQVATIAADATSYDLAVFLPARINASYLLQACNSGGCTDSVVPVIVSGNLAEAVGYFKASNTGGGDKFGSSVALSADGNTLVVGAPIESSAAVGIDGNQADNTATASGAVYLFSRSGNTWAQQAYVKASNTGASDLFGWSVALSADGNTLAVGALGEDSSAIGIDGDQADNSAPSSGAVYLFSRSSGVWSQQAYVKASNTGASDAFGLSVALSADGNTLAVGAYNESSAATGVDGNQADNTAPSSGAVYLFSRSGNTWAQQAYVKASNTEAYDQFGRSVALSADGNTLAVGASNEDSSAAGIDGNQADYTASSSGAVYLFSRSGEAWSQQAYVKASNTGASDYFGAFVVLSADGNTLAVGAYGEDSAAVGIDGDQADNNAPDSGAVYLFSRSSGVWAQQAYVKASNTGASDYFGASVALSADGNTLAVGAYYEDSAATGVDGNQVDNTAPDSGAVYLFSRSGVTWSQQTYVKESNTGQYDKFGFSVALSADGNTLAVGAYGEESSAAGIDGNQADNSATHSGAVYLY